ncbi:hypothetical protein PV326_009153 [Microctonus aethiopoides]|nr:hypothetical protein PV326_009153 [Microctonus aethiopoides]
MDNNKTLLDRLNCLVPITVEQLLADGACWFSRSRKGYKRSETNDYEDNKIERISAHGIKGWPKLERMASLLDYSKKKNKYRVSAMPCGSLELTSQKSKLIVAAPPSLLASGHSRT